MDILKIKSQTVRTIIDALISNWILKKFGVKVFSNLEDLDVEITDDLAVVRFAGTARIRTDDLKEIAKRMK